MWTSRYARAGCPSGGRQLCRMFRWECFLSGVSTANHRGGECEWRRDQPGADVFHWFDDKRYDEKRVCAAVARMGRSPPGRLCVKPNAGLRGEDWQRSARAFGSH